MGTLFRETGQNIRYSLQDVHVEKFHNKDSVTQQCTNFSLWYPVIYPSIHYFRQVPSNSYSPVDSLQEEVIFLLVPAPSFSRSLFSALNYCIRWLGGSMRGIAVERPCDGLSDLDMEKRKPWYAFEFTYKIALVQSCFEHISGILFETSTLTVQCDTKYNFPFYQCGRATRARTMPCKYLIIRRNFIPFHWPLCSLGKQWNIITEILIPT